MFKLTLEFKKKKCKIIENNFIKNILKFKKYNNRWKRYKKNKYLFVLIYIFKLSNIFDILHYKIFDNLILNYVKILIFFIYFIIIIENFFEKKKKIIKSNYDGKNYSS